MKQITKANGNIITFDYDPMGNRIAKHVQTGVGTAIVASTFYTLDAQGNTICVYEVSDDNPTSQVHLTERNIYGSSRVGQEQMDKIMNAQAMFTGTSYMANNFIGDKHYELSNHLGNVLVVVTDRKFPEEGTGTLARKVAYYNPDVVSCSDYYPYGMEMPGRHSAEGGYRYGFQGQEMDDEIKGEGNSVNYKYRMHDPRVGRFFAVDPLSGRFPHNSPYAFSENRVVDVLELEGLEVVVTHLYNRETKKFVQVSKTIDYSFQQNVNRYIYKNENGQITRDVYKSWNTEKNKTEFIAPAGKAPMFDVWRRFSDDAGTGSAFPKGYTVGSYEGPTGFKEKGAPLLITTVTTVATAGSGALVSTVSGAVANGGGNLIGQLASNDFDINKVDVVDVGTATVGGLLKNPWVSTALTAGLDATFDISAEDGVKIAGFNKSMATTASDMFFGAVTGSQSAILSKSGASESIQNYRNAIVGGTTEFMNNTVNGQLK